MLKHYLLVAWRNLLRNRSHALINLLGLSVGLACFSLIYLFILDESSFDSYHSKADRIYRIISTLDDPQQGTRHFASAPVPLAPALVESLPAVEAYVSLFRFGQMVLEHGDQQFNERDWLVSSPDIVQVFDLGWKAGDPATALLEPHSLVLTEASARRIFGEQEAMGKTLKSSRYADLKVTGIVSDPPSNSSLPFDMLVSYTSLPNDWQEYLRSWDVQGSRPYLLLKEGASPDQLTAHLADPFPDGLPEGASLSLQALKDIHFESEEIEAGLGAIRGQKSQIYLMTIVALFILLIATMNYLNLATARSLYRGREIGIRKVVGATRVQLVLQLLGESMLIAMAAFVFSILLFDLALPYFNDLAGKRFVADQATLGKILPGIFLTSLIVGLVSGSFPALFLSGFDPVRILKGELQTGKSGAGLRRGLVITQFVLSITMLLATAVTYQQLQYTRDLDLGFKQDELLIIDINSRNSRNNFAAMKESFGQHPAVQSVAVSSRVPGEWKNIPEIWLQVQEGASQDSLQAHFLGFDKDMLETYEMALLGGENFRGNPNVDSQSVLINETLARMLGWEDPVGKHLDISGEEYSPQIVGLVGDFNFRSLHEPIGPLLIGFRVNPIQSIDYFSLKIQGDKLQEVLAHVGKVEDTFDPGTPMEYHMLDTQIEQFYEADARAGKVFAMGALLTVLIACLGLFGLAAFTAERRTKEIGIRKVLGATEMDLILLLSKHFALQVGIAFLIASPIAAFVMNKWLANFAYRISLSPWLFLGIGMVAMSLALLTVGYRSLRVAKTNPADVLSYE